jgi:predicted DNA binding CopG/RHH family protein
MDNTAEIKAKWNAEHYDQMSVVVPKGSRDLIKQHANEQGMSISEYIRHLIAKDAPQCLTAGGGGIRP